MKRLRSIRRCLGHPLLALVAILGASAPSAYGQIDLVNGCKGPATATLAKKLCDEYELGPQPKQSNPQFKQSQTIQASYAECQKFFATAIESANLVCSYGNDLAGYTKKANALAAKLRNSTTSQVGKSDKSQAAAGRLDADGASIGQTYLAAFRAKWAELKSAADEYSQKGITPIWREGQQNEVLEMSCKGDQVTAPTPGPVELGLAIRAFDQLQQTYQNVRDTLRNAGDSSMRLSKNAGASAALAKDNASVASSITGTKKEKGLEGLKSFTAGGKVDPYDPNEEDKDDGDSDPSSSSLDIYAQEAVAPMLAIKFGTAVAGVVGLGGVAAYEMLVYHKPAYGTLLVAAISTAGAGPGVGALLAKTKYNANQDKLDRYRSFFNDKFAAKLVTPKDASAAWAKEKDATKPDGYNCRVNYPE